MMSSQQKRKVVLTNKSSSFVLTSGGLKDENTGDLYGIVGVKKLPEKHSDHCSPAECDYFESEIFKVQYKWKGSTIAYNVKHCKTGKVPAVVSPLLCGLLSTDHIHIYDEEKRVYSRSKYMVN